MNRSLRMPECRAFRKRGKLMFSEEMRRAFGLCVSDIIVVPVEGVPGDTPRYVLEVIRKYLCH